MSLITEKADNLIALDAKIKELQLVVADLEAKKLQLSDEIEKLGVEAKLLAEKIVKEEAEHNKKISEERAAADLFSKELDHRAEALANLTEQIKQEQETLHNLRLSLNMDRDTLVKRGNDLNDFKESLDRDQARLVAYKNQLEEDQRALAQKIKSNSDMLLDLKKKEQAVQDKEAEVTQTAFNLNAEWEDLNRNLEEYKKWSADMQAKQLRVDQELERLASDRKLVDSELAWINSEKDRIKIMWLQVNKVIKERNIEEELKKAGISND